eukprot:1714108-Pleurochrysis_carterae.AAC.3
MHVRAFVHEHAELRLCLLSDVARQATSTCCSFAKSILQKIQKGCSRRAGFLPGAKAPWPRGKACAPKSSSSSLTHSVVYTERGRAQSCCGSLGVRRGNEPLIAWESSVASIRAYMHRRPVLVDQHHFARGNGERACQVAGHV